MPSSIDSVEQFCSILKDAKIYDLGQPYFWGMAVHPEDPPFNIYFCKYHKHTKKVFNDIAPGFAYALEMVTTSTHSGTHMDARCHMSRNGKVLGVDITDLETDAGFKRFGIDEAPIIVRRAVLLDVCGFKGTDILPPKYGITAAELEATAKSEMVEILEGDVVLVRTGWSKLFRTSPEKYVHEFAGITPDAARWLAQKKIILLGMDNLALGSPDLFEVHMTLISDNGIYVVKNLFLEEIAEDKAYVSTVVVLPLKIEGATGSLVRPIALSPSPT